MNAVKYPNVTVQLTGADGNAFRLIAQTRSALRRAKPRVPEEEIETFTEEAQSGDYDNVLQTIMRWVNTT